MADVQFEDYTIKVLNAMDTQINIALEECAGELESATKRKTRVGQPGAPTKNAWQHYVDEETHTATIGNPLENAIWEEFGTGEHAITENGGKGGRKGAWYVPVDGYEGKKKPTYNGKVVIVYGKNKVKYYKTNGKKPSRAFWNAFTAKKKGIIKRLQNSLKGL